MLSSHLHRAASTTTGTIMTNHNDNTRESSETDTMLIPDISTPSQDLGRQHCADEKTHTDGASCNINLASNSIEVARFQKFPVPDSIVTNATDFTFCNNCSECFEHHMCIGQCDKTVEGHDDIISRRNLFNSFCSNCKAWLGWCQNRRHRYGFYCQQTCCSVCGPFRECDSTNVIPVVDKTDIDSSMISVESPSKISSSGSNELQSLNALKLALNFESNSDAPKASNYNCINSAGELSVDKSRMPTSASCLSSGESDGDCQSVVSNQSLCGSTESSSLLSWKEGSVPICDDSNETHDRTSGLSEMEEGVLTESIVEESCTIAAAPAKPPRRLRHLDDRLFGEGNVSCNIQKDALTSTPRTIDRKLEEMRVQAADTLVSICFDDSSILNGSVSNSEPDAHRIGNYNPINLNFSKDASYLSNEASEIASIKDKSAATNSHFERIEQKQTNKSSSKPILVKAKTNKLVPIEVNDYGYFAVLVGNEGTDICSTSLSNKDIDDNADEVDNKEMQEFNKENIDRRRQQGNSSTSTSDITNREMETQQKSKKKKRPQNKVFSALANLAGFSSRNKVSSRLSDASNNIEASESSRVISSSDTTHSHNVSSEISNTSVSDRNECSNASSSFRINSKQDEIPANNTEKQSTAACVNLSMERRNTPLTALSHGLAAMQKPPAATVSENKVTERPHIPVDYVNAVPSMKQQRRSSRRHGRSSHNTSTASQGSDRTGANIAYDGGIPNSKYTSTQLNSLNNTRFIAPNLTSAHPLPAFPHNISFNQLGSVLPLFPTPLTNVNGANNDFLMNTSGLLNNPSPGLPNINGWPIPIPQVRSSYRHPQMLSNASVVAVSTVNSNIAVISGVSANLTANSANNSGVLTSTSLNVNRESDLGVQHGNRSPTNISSMHNVLLHAQDTLKTNLIHNCTPKTPSEPHIVNSSNNHTRPYFSNKINSGINFGTSPFYNSNNAALISPNILNSLRPPINHLAANPSLIQRRNSPGVDFQNMSASCTSSEASTEIQPLSNSNRATGETAEPVVLPNRQDHDLSSYVSEDVGTQV